MLVRFQFERSTKGAHRYFEINDRGVQLDMQDAVIGTLYVRKSAVGNKPAQMLIVEISNIDAEVD